MIGLVVHAAHRQRFADAASTLTGVTLAWAVYEHEDEIRDRVAGLLRGHRLDGLLLGLVPYARARDLIPADLPVTVTRSAALDLALAWARARGNGWPATPVSIDTFAGETIDEVATALDLDRTAIAALPFEPGQPVADVAAFHREQLARTGASYVISVRMGVAAALDGQTAVLHALATPGTIRADLNELALRVHTKRADGQRFAAGLFRTEKMNGLRQLLLNTPEFADAWIDQHGARGVLVFAPVSLFETVTHQWVGLPVLAEARDTLGVRTVAGFGIGASARLSVTLAERAAARAEQDTDPGAYLFTGDGMTIGPMGATAAPLTYTYREHGDIEDLAARAGLSAATLSRLAAIERGLDGRPLSPSELARALGITDPSGRRLIRKLTTAGLVSESGSAQEHRKGRPTRLYRLSITADPQDRR
ncbi:helix-turn-helix domain-containing protein [Actinoplanes rectilineatus]|uniref:helix-turn-helix domain-containing protein n=1 Tax=Actinoplanes rectilineatus TaxID=113571 RepID=UPI0005F2EF11|nr:helix-turn-helix domain-containing protein [Actinoplanes rectilineatus]